MPQWHLRRVCPVVCMPMKHNKKCCFPCGSSFRMMTGVGIVGVFSVSFSDLLSDISIPKLVAPPLLSFFLVLRMPDFGFFILPFGVAGDGARYL